MMHYDGGEWITLERFEDWYGIHDGIRYPLQTVKLLVYNDPETPFLKLRAQELSIVSLTASQYKKYVLDETDPTSPFKDGRLVIYKGLRPQYYYIAFKNTHPFFRDRNVRRALSLACNVEAIASKIFLGRLVPMAGPIYPGSPSADPDLKPLGFDLKEAARLLDEAGWKLSSESGIREKSIDGQTRRFEFEIVGRSQAPELEALIEHFRNDLRSIGVVMTPLKLEWSLYLEKLHDRDFAAALAGWGTNAWDQDFDQIWTSKQIQVAKSSNYIEYSNAEVDRLSESLRTEMDVEKRKDAARRVGRAIFEDNPVCFVGWVRVYGAHWAWLHNAIEQQYKTRPFIRSFPAWTSR
jgi:peptide/nickel transport system substrate-binding protein